MSPIEIALVLLLVHAMLGAFDTFYNHEYRERLPSRAGSTAELALHSVRSALFALTFVGLAWCEWHGAWAWMPLIVIATEYAVTLADSVVEDSTRRLAAVERLTHMLLALNTGLYAALVGMQVLGDWINRPTAVNPVFYPWLTWALTGCGAATALWMVRDGWASLKNRLGKRDAQLLADF